MIIRCAFSYLTATSLIREIAYFTTCPIPYGHITLYILLLWGGCIIMPWILPQWNWRFYTLWQICSTCGFKSFCLRTLFLSPFSTYYLLFCRSCGSAVGFILYSSGSDLAYLRDLFCFFKDRIMWWVHCIPWSVTSQVVASHCTTSLQLTKVVWLFSEHIGVGY